MKLERETCRVLRTWVNLYVAVNRVPRDCLVKVDSICDLTIFVCSFRYSFLVQMNRLCALLCSGLSRVRLFAAPWTVPHQAPLSMEFFRQEYRSGSPVPSPGYLPDPAIKSVSLASPALAGGFFTTSVTLGSPVSLTSDSIKLNPHTGRVKSSQASEANKHCFLSQWSLLTCRQYLSPLRTSIDSSVKWG